MKIRVKESWLETDVNGKFRIVSSLDILNCSFEDFKEFNSKFDSEPISKIENRGETEERDEFSYTER